MTKEKENEQEQEQENETEEKEGDVTIPPKEKKKADLDPSPLETANELVAQMKEQNDKFSANLKRQEKLAAESLLGGRAGVGATKTEDEKIVDDARKILKGTGYADELFPK